MKYRQGRRFGLSHEDQSYLYFFCLGYWKRGAKDRRVIDNLCRKVGGDRHSEALFAAVTTSERILDVAVEYEISEAYLSRMVKEFFQELSSG